MSKLDEKLAASVKPSGRKPAPAKTSSRPTAKKMPATPKTTPAQVAAKVAAGMAEQPVSDLNSPGASLFPARIWPD